MALEIQSDVGGKDADLKEITAEESEKVDQTIVNNIYGGNVYLSGGNSTMTATTIQHNSRTSWLVIGAVGAGSEGCWYHSAGVEGTVGRCRGRCESEARRKRPGCEID